MSTADGPGRTEDPSMGDLYDELRALEETVDDPDERERVQEVMRLAVAVEPPAVFGRVVKGFGAEDVAEGLLGSLIFGIPMFVEGGTLEVGEFVAGHPLSLAGTVTAAVGLVVGILYVADIQDVRISNPILGVLPRRLVGVVGVSFLMALVVMTAWGRVDWTAPWVAFCQVCVAFAPMSLGAALGDILPGT